MPSVVLFHLPLDVTVDVSFTHLQPYLQPLAVGVKWEGKERMPKGNAPEA